MIRAILKNGLEVSTKTEVQHKSSLQGSAF